MGKGEFISLILMGDVHESETTPDSRTDDYQATRDRKRENIIKLAKKHKVSAIVHTGDFHDKFNPDMAYAGEVIHKWTKSGIPLVGVVGNHDCYGNLNTFNRTLGKFIENAGLMTICSKEKPYIIEQNGFKLSISGASHHLRIDNIENREDYIVEEKTGDYQLHIVHGYLSVTQKPYEHTLIDKILKTKADFTLAGHDHLGFETVYTDGKIFANPGAIARITADKSEIARIPKVLLLKVSTKDGSAEVTELSIGAEDGKKVLSRKKIEQREKKERKRQEIQSEIKKAALNQHTSLEDIIDEIAKAKGISEDVLKRALDDILDKRMLLSKKKYKGPKLLRVVLENFQRHKYTDLTLDNGLNIFVGESGKGKSSIIRGIDWVYENQPTGKRIIKRGEDFAKVTLYFENGVVISRYTEAKTGGKNGFYIYDPITDEETFENTKSLPLVQEKIGHSVLTIDGDYEIPLNFSKQGDTWFLIGKGYTPSIKAKLVGSLYDIHFADAVIRDIDKTTKNIESTIKKEEKKIESYDEKIETYDYIDSLENQISKGKKIISDIQVLIDRKTKILNLKEEYDKIENIFKQIYWILDSTKDLEVGYRSLIEAKTQYNQLFQIERLKKQLIETTENINYCFQIKKDTKDIDVVFSHIDELKRLQKNREEKVYLKDTFNNLLETKNKTIEQLENEKEVLSKTKDLKNGITNLNNIKSLIENKNKIMKEKEVYDEKLKLIKEQENLISNYDKETNKLLEEYQEVLLEAGQCPVCMGNIDNVVVGSIIDKYSK